MRVSYAILLAAKAAGAQTRWLGRLAQEERVAAHCKAIRKDEAYDTDQANGAPYDPSALARALRRHGQCDQGDEQRHNHEDGNEQDGFPQRCVYGSIVALQGSVSGVAWLEAYGEEGPAVLRA